MTECSCPACGAPVRFQSKVSVFCVCPFCSQMLVRRDLAIEAIGKMAVLPEDSSPLQVGTEGKFEGRKFTLLGRLRQQWSDGNWNEWFALFDDGRNGWLAEAQGFYMISFDCSAHDSIPPSDTLKAGQKVPISGKTFEVEDIKSVTCVGSEGELPFSAPKGRQCMSVDLAGDQKSFACLDYSSEGIHVYVGKYLEFDDFNFKKLRQIDGW